jgi:hypothetical protein
MTTDRKRVTIGMVLDYYPFESESSTRVRVKGFHSAGRNQNKEPGFVYLVPDQGGAPRRTARYLHRQVLAIGRRRPAADLQHSGSRRLTAPTLKGWRKPVAYLHPSAMSAL